MTKNKSIRQSGFNVTDANIFGVLVRDSHYKQYTEIQTNSISAIYLLHE